MYNVYSLTLLAAASALLFTGVSVSATNIDSQIQSSLSNSYVFRTYLREDFITIGCTDGAVTLIGAVAEKCHKTLAEYTVEALPNVKKIDNQLLVREGAPTEHSDLELKTKVVVILAFYQSMTTQGTDVSVTDGVVRLQGVAPSSIQKELTTEYAKEVEGVKAVTNEMTIGNYPVRPTETTGETIDDASITAQIRWSLQARHSTSGLPTPRIQTTNGVVTFSGLARNEAERILVTRYVSEIKGITGVINTMTLEAVVSKENSRPRPVKGLRVVNN